MDSLTTEAKQHFQQAANTSFVQNGYDAATRKVFETVHPDMWDTILKQELAQWPMANQLAFNFDIQTTTSSMGFGYGMRRRRHLLLVVTWEHGRYYYNQIALVRNKITNTSLPTYSPPS